MFDCAAYIMLCYVVHAFILSACSMSIIMFWPCYIILCRACSHSYVYVQYKLAIMWVMAVNGVSVLRCVLLCCMHHCVVLCMRS